MLIRTITLIIMNTAAGFSPFLSSFFTVNNRNDRRNILSPSFSLRNQMKIMLIFHQVTDYHLQDSSVRTDASFFCALATRTTTYRGSDSKNNY